MSEFWRHCTLVVLLALLLSIYLHGLPPATAKLTPQFEQPIQQAIELAQEGKKSYDRGQFTAAAIAISKAAKVYQAAGQHLEQIQALSLLSLVYEKLGQWQQAEETIASCLSLLEQIPDSSSRDRVRAQVLNRQGRWQLARGNTEAAIVTSQAAEFLYTKLNNSTGKIGSQINQAQAWQALGFYRRAENILMRVAQQLRAQKPSSIRVTGLQNLGNLLRQKGDIKRSEQILKESLVLAKKLGLSAETSQILIDLGNNQHNQALINKSSQNTEQSRVYYRQALEYYQQAQLRATLPITTIKVQLNQLTIFIETEQLSSAKNLLTSISEELNQLAPSRESIYLYINFANNLMQLESDLDIVLILNTAIQQAKNLQDMRAESYALGTLGQFYEHTLDWKQGKQITESALLIAHKINSPDLTYRWQWQLGRLLEKQQTLSDGMSSTSSAIAAYTEAVNDLQSLRGNLVAINPDVQFFFREEVEPVYRQLVDLLLRSDETTKPSQQNLQQSRNVLESLQLAELENFFHSACLEAKVNLDRVIEQESSNTAVIYPIILENRLEIIVKLSKTKKLYHYTSKVAAEQVEDTLSKLQNYLPDVTRTSQVNDLSQQLYQWLIQPATADFKTRGVETLVFVLDGTLRNIPMSILYDAQNEQYLIEKYAIAIAPSLQLIEPKALGDNKLNTLIAGVDQSRLVEGREFASLDYVQPELKRIASEIPKSEALLNQQFTPDNLRRHLESGSFSIVHLATHGEFSSDLEQTFILTWNKLLKVKDFANLLQTSDLQANKDIELLVLSACQTATGDKRAGLGLAGIAVQAGARSTLATLWSIDDAFTTDIMSQFYRGLDQNATKAKALRKAQLTLLEREKRPYFWASYVLIGNWL
jgi:CHAT domain-containing protein